MFQLQVVFVNTVPNGLTISGATIAVIAIFLVSREKISEMTNEYKRAKSMPMIELYLVLIWMKINTMEKSNTLW